MTTSRQLIEGCKQTFLAINQIAMAASRGHQIKVDGKEVNPPTGIMMQTEAALRAIEAHLKETAGEAGPPPGEWTEDDGMWRYHSGPFTAKVDAEQNHFPWVVKDAEGKVKSKGDGTSLELSQGRALSILKTFLNMAD